MLFTRFTVPADGGLLVANTAFMTAVAASGEAFAPDGPDDATDLGLTAYRVPDQPGTDHRRLPFRRSGAVN